MFNFSKIKDNTWGPLAAFGAAIGAYLLPQIVIYLVIDLMGASGTVLTGLDEQTTALLQAASTIGILLLAFGFMRSRGVGPRYFFTRPAVKDRLKWLKLVLAALAVYLAISLIAAVVVASFLPPELIDQTQDIGFSTSSQGLMLVPVALTLIVIVPLGEEVIFRGLLYRGLRQKLNYWFATIISGGLFALAHWQFNVGIDVFIMSFALTWVYEKTDSLYAPILLHALKNSVAFVLLFVVG